MLKVKGKKRFSATSAKK